MTKEERRILLLEGNEEAFKRLAATIIKDALTEYVCKIRKGQQSAYILRYIHSNDFKFYCDMVDVKHSDIINSKMLKDRIGKKKI